MESYHYSPQASSWAVVSGENNNSSSTTTLTPHHPPKERRNNSNITKRSSMRLSTDPQSVAARQRRHRISDRFRVLKSLVPGGSKMDTVSMLEEAINYVKFLKAQIWLHQAEAAAMMAPNDQDPNLINFPSYNYSSNYLNTANSVSNNVSAYSSSVVPNDQEMLSYSLPPLPPTLAQAQDQEEMAPNFSINYYY